MKQEQHLIQEMDVSLTRNEHVYLYSLHPKIWLPDLIL